MDVMTENKVVPKLRFGEFQDGWESSLLNEVSTITTGSTPSTSKKEYYDGQRLFVSPADIEDNRFVVTTKTTLTELGFKKGRKLAKGSVLFVCIGSTIGKIAQVYEECMSNQQINALTANSNNSNDFIFSLLSLKAKKIKRLAGVQAVPQLNKTDFSKLIFYFPSLSEQQKIASFLSAVDEKLQQLTKKKELLEEYKKGVMQKIFSQELRFKDNNGNNYPHWEEKKLGEVLIERKEMSLKCEEFEHISLTTKGVVPKSKQYMRDFLVNDDSSKKYKVTRLNDICYNPANLKFGVICRNKYGDGIFSPIYVTFQVSKSDSVFMEYFLVRADFISKARKYEEGTVYERMAVKPSDFISLLVCLPSLEEQKKIAKFLSILDRRIKLVSTQIENTKAFKKGLLQQMFV